MIGSVLFTWLQGADFYRDLHKQAVDSIPFENGKTWIDMGCGPGLVSRLAANNGFDVTGIDSSPSMIKAARRLANWHNSTVNYEIGDLDSLTCRKADVISAASLLAVLPEKMEGLRVLWNSVQAGGYLLIIEPTEMMSLENTTKAIAAGLPKKRIGGLKMWTKARENRAVDPKMFQCISPIEKQCLELLHGLVKAWVFRKELIEI